jgi:hypothetical protein
MMGLEVKIAAIDFVFYSTFDDANSTINLVFA